MDELPISSPYRSTPDNPVGEIERESLSARLGNAYGTGALDEPDYRHRLDLLYAARTYGELVPVVTGLPATPAYEVPDIVAQQRGPGPLAPTPRPGARPTLLLVAGLAVAVAVIVVLIVLVVT